MGAPRIKDLSMSTMDVLVVMSGGNPGALTVMMQLLEKTKDIDPNSALEGLGKILSLDTYRIYDSRIWQFYSDVCKKNFNAMLGVMRSVQLGYLSEKELNHAIDNYGEGLDIAALLKRVKERLPDFIISEEPTQIKA